MSTIPDKKSLPADTPPELIEAVEACEYKPGWRAFVQYTAPEDSFKPTPRCTGHGLLLVLHGRSYDSYHVDKGETWEFANLISVRSLPFKTVSEWSTWIFNQILDTEYHEAAEFFSINGERPFNPHRSDG